MNNLFHIIPDHTPLGSEQFQTPLPVAKYMVSLIPPGTKTILEPTPGEFNIVNLIKDNYTVTAPADFFLWERERVDCVIGNPPFSAQYANLDNAPMGLNKAGMRFGYYILSECMKISNNVIMLMPWFTILDSDIRMRQLHDYGLKSLTALPRNTFNYARIQTCVFELQKGYKGVTEFKVFDRLTTNQ
jgi:hypothetical protein